MIMKHLLHLKALSHDIFRTLRADRSYHAPLIEKKLTGTRRECTNNFYPTRRDRDTQRAHCYVSAIRRLLHVSSYVRQGAGCPSTGSTGATVSIFLVWDSEA